MMEIFGWGKKKKKERPPNRFSHEVPPQERDYWNNDLFNVTRGAHWEFFHNPKSPVVSSAMEADYPELFSSESEHAIGVVSFDFHGTEAQDLASKGKSPVAIAHDFRHRFEESLRSLARHIEEYPNGRMAEIEYFIGYSRLARLGSAFGFSVYDDDNTTREGQGLSVEKAKRTHDAYGLTESDAKAPLPKGGEQYAIISKEKLLERYGTK